MGWPDLEDVCEPVMPGRIESSKSAGPIPCSIAAECRGPKSRVSLHCVALPI